MKIFTDRRRDPDISVVRDAPRNNPILATTRNPKNAGSRHWQPQQETIMTTTTAKGALHRRAVHELKEFVILFTYLYITIGAVVLLKAAVLHAQGNDSIVWGIAVVKAALLAKFMMLGYVMKIGEHNSARALIWPTLHKAFVFLVLLIIMTIIEEAIVGLFHRQSIAASLAVLAGPRLEETLAGYLINPNYG